LEEWAETMDTEEVGVRLTTRCVSDRDCCVVGGDLADPESRPDSSVGGVVVPLCCDGSLVVLTGCSDALTEVTPI
jgi:hypothetical protein